MPTRFAIIEQGTGIKGKTIIFRVKELVNWIGVGICLKNRIIDVNYAFKCRLLTIKMKRWAMEVIYCPIMDILGRTVGLRIIFTHAPLHLNKETLLR
jgi:hypothetical protein